MKSFDLRCVHSESSGSAPIKIKVDASVSGSFFSGVFEVRSSAPFHVNADFGKDEPAHGLWEFDVVEVFLQPSSERETYYEFVLSPLNQFFELEVFEPRKRVNYGFRSGFSHEIMRHDRFFTAKFEIDLKRLGYHDRDDLRAGFFGAFGQAGKRQYYAAFLPDQKKPDFHLPHYFEKI